MYLVLRLQAIFLTLLAAILIPFNVFAVGESSERVGEESAITDTKDSPPQSATFTLYVGDWNSTIISNKTAVLGNATEKIMVSCEPLNVEVRQAKSTTVFCKVHNSGYQDVELKSQIFGLEGTGISYMVNGNKSTETILVSANSSETFDVTMLVSQIKENEIGKSYDYIIRLTCLGSIEC